MNEPLEVAARRYEQAADELERAAAHLRTAAAHMRAREVPRACAHGAAAEGHVSVAQSVLDEQKREHAERSSLPDE